MRFPGELKFPDLDHPGVPVEFHIEGNQAELKLEGAPLGKWSLYDVRADRLIASAFLVKFGEEEITFVADDPIDFAYRGVEHMANVWAGMKSKRLGARGIAVSRSRRGTVESRLGEVRQAMEENLGQRPLAGEPVPAAYSSREGTVAEPLETVADWDQRDQVAEIPSIGSESPEVPATAPPATSTPEPRDTDLTEEQRRLEEERRRLEEERGELERQRADAEQREANLFEAYRLEVQRLEAEREELRRQSAAAAERATIGAQPSAADFDAPDADHAPEAAEPESDAAERALEAAKPDPAGEQPEPDPEPALEPDGPETEPAEDRDEEKVGAGKGVVNLNDYEDRRDEEPPRPPRIRPAPAPALQPDPQPEPALAGVAPKEKAGLMGAVRAAFRGGPRDHDHQFTEAPGGLGITRYVCEECGYVSISVGG